LVLFFLPLAGMALAGDSITRMIDVRPGMMHMAVIDKGYSPVIYRGFTPSAGMSFGLYKKHKTELYFLDYSAGVLKNRFNATCNMQTFAFSNFTFYHRKQSRWQWGWSNFNDFQFRNFSDARNYQTRSHYYTSIGPAAHWQRNLRRKLAPLKLEALFHMQLIGFRLQSGAVSGLPAGLEGKDDLGAKDWIKATQFFFPGNSLSVGIHPSLSWELKSGTRLALGYRWDWLRLNPAEQLKVMQSRGNYQFSIQARL